MRKQMTERAKYERFPSAALSVTLRVPAPPEGEPRKMRKMLLLPLSSVKILGKIRRNDNEMDEELKKLQD